ncbi:MAG: 16S rRNA (adenine(1518)-N(6)/adenine(1519)-N(6))-dimethyltransferase RsmA [Candidatus Komeilibacteria bacterium]
MSLLDETRVVIKKFHLRPDTDRGQNFLISESVLADIIAAADLDRKDVILEIGTGLGTLTKSLAAVAKKVITIESDRRLQPLLADLAGQYSNVQLVMKDFTKVGWSELAAALGPRYKVVANIPYYITGKIVEQLLSWEVLPQSIIFLVQAEVGKKYCAKVGDLSKQSLAVQFYSIPEAIKKVPAKSFWPVPQVDSAIIRLSQIHSWNYSAPEKPVWQLIRIGFSSKRKKLVNNLAAGLQISKSEAEKMVVAIGLDSNVRAEDLTKEQWVELVKIKDKKAK